LREGLKQKADALNAMIQLDGATGEGGGQILRTSLSLSMVTGQPFRMENIRAGRQKPGLLRQHLTAVLAAAEVCGAVVEGGVIGSKTLSFTPGAVRSGEYKFAVGTAGSATLVFQTLLPALMLASGRSVVTIEGGTHNLAAPPFDFLERTFLPFVRRMGPQIAIRLNRYGFYPAGGGSIIAEIEPVQTLAVLEMKHLGESPRITGRAVLANLPRYIAARELAIVAERFGLEKDALEIVDTKNSAGPGNVVMVECHTSDAVHVFTGFGRLGVSAEQVAEDAVRQAQIFMGNRVAADEHLADQILLPLALGEGGSFSTTKLSNHALTNMMVIKAFFNTEFKTAPSTDDQSCEVRVSPLR
jgi:RNA 3'-terminal phosphate cyclase (ATP)